jgi:leucyl/phenylalanyl-tRNA---protein transferase
MKRRVVFPPVENATEDGLVAVGGDLEIDTIEEAYRRGIFPWPISVEFPLAWFSPNPRGILDFSDLHLSRSFEKFLRKNNFRATFNTAFPAVIRACARMVRKNQPDTWITPQMIKGYEQLFLHGKAYSAETWHGEELVGGVYGVVMGEFVSGESMFMKEDNASKFALYALIKKLEASGIKWLDTQMVTPVVDQFGGKLISRENFLKKIADLSWTKNRSEIL